ncbi:PREDICTED: uncharacterized protein LOC104738708 [Camelina sativa]|uniref:Uncharacterized protein LOC104738708 n=1 Tax=Camelina sativa TaxID=90675 RepID=A0ABM0VJJ7_CAMSA|nr:PREDICTED: uncharacterized protein LOC104738708 [Camelina sativa]
MGSAQSTPNPQASQLNAEAPITVWWDVENCLPPSEIDVHSIGWRIRRSLRNLGYQGAVEIIGVIANDTKLPEKVLARLKLPTSGVHIHDCENETGEKQVSDAEIKARMGAWRDLNIHPRNAMIISGDGDFLDSSQSLRDNGYNLKLAYRPGATAEEVLESAPPTNWTWRKLLGLRDKPLKKKKPRSPPPTSPDRERSPSPEAKRFKGNRFAVLLGCK